MKNQPGATGMPSHEKTGTPVLPGAWLFRVAWLPGVLRFH